MTSNKQSRTWLITGVSSGFGRTMTEQLPDAGETAVGTVRSTAKVVDLIKSYPETFDCRILDVTDVTAVEKVVGRAFDVHGHVDVVVSNAGYGLFGAAEELSDDALAELIG